MAPSSCIQDRFPWSAACTAPGPGLWRRTLIRWIQPVMIKGSGSAFPQVRGPFQWWQVQDSNLRRDHPTDYRTPLPTP